MQAHLRCPLGTLASCTLLALFTPSAAADVPRPGFALAQIAYPGQTDIATLSNGDLVTFDGLAVNRYNENGVLLQTLTTFPSFVFDGLFAVDPSETFLLLGESSSGDVFRVDLAAGGKTFLANLVFNFDAAFDTPTTAIVSAATGGFGAGNDLVRLDTQTGATTPVALLSGPSGPLVFDDLGNLFYGSQDPFPAGPGTSEVVVFSAAQLASGALLSDADAVVFSSGFDALADLARDPRTGGLLLSANNFATGANRIYQLAGSESLSPVLVEGDPGASIGALELEPGPGPATFQAFQPPGGGTLRYVSADFLTGVRRRLAAVPARPQASLSGPGTGGPGIVTLSVSGAQPLGTMFVVFGPSALVSSIETVLALPGLPPIHTGLDLATLSFVPFFLPVGASAQGSFAFFNPGTLTGQLALQVVVGDAFARTLGTSTVATL